MVRTDGRRWRRLRRREPGGVFAVDALQGNELWHVPTDEPVFSSPAVTDEAVYVGTDGGQVLALDGTDGTERWRFAPGGGVTSSPAVVDGRLFVGTDSGRVVALGGPEQ